MALADAPPAVVPTGIDYLRLIQTRHTHSLGERLQYAQLTDPPPPSSSPAEASAPPADAAGLAYDTDLLALASTSEQASDPQLEAELAGFAALHNEQRADVVHPSDLKESQ